MAERSRSGGSAPRLRQVVSLTAASLLVSSHLAAQAAAACPRSSPEPGFVNHLGRRAALANEDPVKGPPSADSLRIPMKITNNCQDTIWPAVFTQHGIGPGVGGFELPPATTANLFVGPTWQGRIWGRTNCTVNGDSASCTTGDCWHLLDCPATGEVPATLFEANLAGGFEGNQVFYDISLVDGYNLPMGVRYLPFSNASTFVPPNLVNAVCIATPGWLDDLSPMGMTYSNASYPTPWEPTETNDSMRQWCPWDLLKFPPEKPGDGVYAYPDDNIQHPDFSPCLSACARYNTEEFCCTGKFHDPDVCQPSDYTRRIKKACPDAYSYAYDDQKSTFVIPANMGGWETIFCPRGRSTNILRVFSDQLSQLSENGNVSADSLKLMQEKTWVSEKSEENHAPRPSVGALRVGLVAIIGAVVAVVCVW